MWTNVTYCQSWRPEADQLIQPCLYRIWGGRALVIHIMLLGERPGYIIAPKSLQMGTCQEDDTWHDDWTWWKQWNVLPIIRVNCLNVTHTRFPLTAPLNSRALIEARGQFCCECHRNLSTRGHSRPWVIMQNHICSFSPPCIKSHILMKMISN